MKITKNRNSKKLKKTIITLSAATLLLLLIATYVFVNAHNTSREDSTLPASINVEKPSEGEIDAGNNVKNETIQNNIEPTPEKDGIKDIAMTLTFISTGDVYRATATINALTSSGTCDLEMSGPNGARITESAGVQPVTNYTTCKGFNIDRSKLSPGTWSISVKYSGEGLSSQSTIEEQIQ